MAIAGAVTVDIFTMLNNIETYTLHERRHLRQPISGKETLHPFNITAVPCFAVANLNGEHK